MLHQREAAPLWVCRVCGVGVLVWVEACDMDQRVALVGETQLSVVQRVLLESLRTRIDVQLLAVAISRLFKGVGVRPNKLGKRACVEVLLLLFLLLVCLVTLQRVISLAERIRIDFSTTRERRLRGVAVGVVVVIVEVQATEVAIERNLDEAKVCVDHWHPHDAPHGVLC